MRCKHRNNLNGEYLMKIFCFVVLLVCSGPLLAGGALPFDDSGESYNPLDYVRTIKTGDGAYTIEFRNDEESYFTNFVDTSDGVVAFDPLSDSAAVVYSKVIREKAPNKPLLAIIYSHLHTDHIAGARVLRREFGAGIPIIAHERVLQFLRDRRLPFIDLPTDTVTNAGKVYRFGNRTIELRYIGDAHTASILVPTIPELRMAYVCDYANNDVVGWTDLPGINVDEMIRMQRRTAELDVDTITFCHGPPGTPDAIRRQIDYFETVLAEADKALKKGLTEEQAVETIALPQYKHFANYDDWFEGNVRAMYRWVKSKRVE